MGVAQEQLIDPLSADHLALRCGLEPGGDREQDRPDRLWRGEERLTERAGELGQMKVIDLPTDPRQVDATSDRPSHTEVLGSRTADRDRCDPPGAAQFPGEEGGVDAPRQEERVGSAVSLPGSEGEFERSAQLRRSHCRCNGHPWGARAAPNR